MKLGFKPGSVHPSAGRTSPLARQGPGPVSLCEQLCSGLWILGGVAHRPPCSLQALLLLGGGRNQALYVDISFPLFSCHPWVSPT